MGGSWVSKVQTGIRCIFFSSEENQPLEQPANGCGGLNIIWSLDIFRKAVLAFKHQLLRWVHFLLGKTLQWTLPRPRLLLKIRLWFLSNLAVFENVTVDDQSGLSSLALTSTSLWIIICSLQKWVATYQQNLSFSVHYSKLSTGKTLTEIKQGGGRAGWCPLIWGC